MFDDGGFDWNGNGHRDFGDSYMDYEIANDNGSKNNTSYYRARKKKKKIQYTSEQLEVNGKFLRILFIVVGILFAIPVLFNNLGLLLAGSAYVSWVGLIISPIILIVIVRNIINHMKNK